MTLIRKLFLLKKLKGTLPSPHQHLHPDPDPGQGPDQGKGNPGMKLLFMGEREECLVAFSVKKAFLLKSRISASNLQNKYLD